MDQVTARSTLNRELTVRSERRARLQDEIDQEGRQIGAVATYLRDELGQPKARSAEFARLSPSYMTELMRSAYENGVTIVDPLQRIPFLMGPSLQQYVAERGGPRRVIASFASSDPFYMAKLDPESIRDEHYGNGLRPPPMLVQTRETNEWVGVDNVTVGYGGSGPTNAHRELTGLGIDPELALDVANFRVSDVDLDSPDDRLRTNKWPHVPLELPTPIGGFFAVAIDVGAPSYDGAISGPETDELDVTHNGFYATLSTHPLLTRWLTMLDSAELPEWLSGDRRARVYLNRSLAQEHGFSEHSLAASWGYEPTVYQVIIEQGRLQLWLNIPTSNDPTVLFTPEIYDALEQAGFYADEYQAKDAQAAFWRWLRSRGSQRPDSVDLYDRALLYTPPGN